MSVVLFPDATSIVVDYLDEQLTARGQAVPVRSQIPNPRPTPFVRVLRVGGVRRDRVTDVPRLSVECWHASEQEAQDLAQLCRALMFDMTGYVSDGHAIYSVNEAGGPGSFPDPLSDQPRFTFTHEIAIRGRAL